MCNNYGHDVPYRRYVEETLALNLSLIFPRGAPNLEPLENIRPTDVAPIIKGQPDGSGVFDTLRWGFPPSKPKAGPVINFRSDGRSFTQGRCLVPASCFYEFTGTKYPKTKWRFTVRGDDWFCMAGLWRKVDLKDGPGEAFTILTCAPGPDLVPYHDRQVVVLPRSQWGAWLDTSKPINGDTFEPAPEGSFEAEEVKKAG
ncbi:MAG TPA: SOS response-associated peptidase [Caulobacteraceae bacterium]|jgi:putative SOS response-associated peptidase YedK